MTDTDLNALIAGLERDAKAWAGSVGPTPRLEREAASALVRLRDENARLKQLNQEILDHDRAAEMEALADADRAEAEVARLTEMDAYNTDIIARFEAKLTAAEARISDLEVVLHSSRTILGNMAAENKDAIFNRWPIKHEPLRADARNLLPLIDKVLYGE